MTKKKKLTKIYPYLDNSSHHLALLAIPFFPKFSYIFISFLNDDIFNLITKIFISFVFFFFISSLLHSLTLSVSLSFTSPLPASPPSSKSHILYRSISFVPPHRRPHFAFLSQKLITSFFVCLSPYFCSSLQLS